MSSTAKFIGAVITVIAVIAGIIAAFSVTRFSTQPDQVGLHYSAGPFSNTEYADYIPPSTRVWDGPADLHYAYYAGQATYNFTDTAATNAATDGNKDTAVVDGGSFSVVDGQNIELTVQGIITFNLDVTEDKLVAFHEEIGRRREAYLNGNAGSSGWATMLEIYMRQPLQKAITEASSKYTWQELYNNEAKRTEWEDEIKENLPAYIEDLMGDDYFTNISVTLQKPEIPQQLIDANTAQQVAVQENIAQEARNDTVATELESIEALVKVLGVDGYNTYKAIESGAVTVYPIPQGSDVIVNSGSVSATPSGSSD